MILLDRLGCYIRTVDALLLVWVCGFECWMVWEGFFCSWQGLIALWVGGRDFVVFGAWIYYAYLHPNALLSMHLFMISSIEYRKCISSKTPMFAKGLTAVLGRRMFSAREGAQCRCGSSTFESLGLNLP